MPLPAERRRKLAEIGTMNFLDQLPISPPEKEKLLQLAVTSPSALLGMIHASSDAFAQFFGPHRTEQLVEWLTAFLGTEEGERLSRPAHRYPIQAPIFAIGPAPPLLSASCDIEERDRIFRQLQQLRADPHPSDQTREEIAACETRLNAMLD